MLSPIRLLLLSTLCALATACDRGPVEAVLFSQVDDPALAAYRGMTYGVTWGDADDDQRPDVYLTHHLRPAQLLLNRGATGFQDGTARFFTPEALRGDHHGAVWADFDNDGDQDLAQMTGAVKGQGEEPKRLFVNEGGSLDDGAPAGPGVALEALSQRVGAALRDVAPELGVDNLLGRTRMPLWFDFDGDGRLDLFQGTEKRLDARSAPNLFLQREAGFMADQTLLPVASTTVPFCVVSDVVGDAAAEVLCRIAGDGQTLQLFQRQPEGGWRDLALFPATGFEDLAAADFDGDGLIDVYLARRNPPGSVALAALGAEGLMADVELEVRDSEARPGFGFRTPGAFSVRIAPSDATHSLGPGDVHLGEPGHHPDSLEFTVRPGEVAVGARTPASADAPSLHFIQPAAGQWQVVFVPGPAQGDGKRRQHRLQVEVRAEQALQDLAVLGGEAVDEAAPDRLFMNRGGRFEEEGAERGLDALSVPSVNVAAADFDNDADVDLYVVASGEVGNRENALLLNDGRGHFRPVRAAGGADGGTQGVGEAVAVADFDDDGFLDVLVSNGSSMGRSLGLPSDSGDYRLYRNLGNANHWLQIDLVGTRSNRNGIGARVEVLTGERRQVRIQDGGVHHRAQNHQRLHFGLGAAERVDDIVVHWPSGVRQSLGPVAADARITVTEPRD